ncbi:MAG: zinc ribbon domain-containing protein, partial [Halobacteriales archaeon]
MSNADEDPRCPECGEPIGQTATYCMHCSADLTEELEAADADEDGAWDSAEATTGDATGGTAMPSATSDESGGTIAEGTTTAMDVMGVNTGAAGGDTEQLLAPDGLLDDTLTVLVGIVGGIVVGLVGTSVLLAVTGSGWAVLLGLIAWLGATAYLVRRPTVQGAVAKSGYAVAVVLLLVPVIALSPV